MLRCVRHSRSYPFWLRQKAPPLGISLAPAERRIREKRQEGMQNAGCSEIHICPLGVFRFDPEISLIMFLHKNRMVDAITKDNFLKIVVVIILAALIVRIIYAFCEVLGIWTEEVFDENYRDGYTRTTNTLAGAVIVTGLCILLFFIIYNWYIKRTAQICGNI